ncbi:hypothetical protein GDO86_000872 [Hymenochirus boettgeri]|uniref:Uncharacterized protein n=1 Tax=Hymenochirus boettgeri TaxID=247094 RepID=A0A8T2KIM8_9PIPI|nr:hypothetical protein GDO86_000872 [Hymenochirus boettgeri]
MPPMPARAKSTTAVKSLQAFRHRTQQPLGPMEGEEPESHRKSPRREHSSSPEPTQGLLTQMRSMLKEELQAAITPLRIEIGGTWPKNRRYRKPPR